MKFACMVGLAGALGVLPSLAVAQKDRDDRTGVAEAVRFERAKQAAADRQARVEARGAESRSADRIADRERPETRRKSKVVKRASEDRTAQPRRDAH
jgi:hypothetical protein